jgi:hypothetical protein
MSFYKRPETNLGELDELRAAEKNAPVVVRTMDVKGTRALGKFTFGSPVQRRIVFIPPK